MRIREWVVKWKKFLANEKFKESWIKELAKEKASKDFTPELKRQVRERDDYTCQECGIKARQLRQMNSYLTIHHIDFNHKNCKKSNLITLCMLCHAKTNFIESSWIKYYSLKAEEIYRNKRKPNEQNNKSS